MAAEAGRLIPSNELETISEQLTKLLAVEQEKIDSKKKPLSVKLGELLV